MVINDLFENDLNLPTSNGYHSPEDDNSVTHLKDMRKARITLAHLNRLRMARDIRKLELSQKVEQVKKQYAPPAQGGDMGGMPAF